ncbi:MAG TPA: hypothetical protein VFZ70_13415, partial [Euzebyales bacterium]
MDDDTAGSVPPGGPGPFRDTPAWTARLHTQNGLETIEVAVISGAIVLLIIMALPPLTNGIQNAVTAVSNALTA